MGTKCLTHVIGNEFGRSRNLVTLLRESDGNIEVHGGELFHFLKHVPKYLGAGCLAAQMVAKFKTKPGEFLIVPTFPPPITEEYDYRVIVNRNKSIIVTCCSYNIVDLHYFYEGDVEGFGEFVKARLGTV